MIMRGSLDDIKALARGADGLLADPAFVAAVKSLEDQWYGELMDDKTGWPEIQDLVIKLRTLRAIPKRLESLKAAPQFRGPDVRRAG